MAENSERVEKSLRGAGLAATAVGLLVFSAGFVAARDLQEWHSRVAGTSSMPGLSVIFGLVLVGLGIGVLRHSVICLRTAAVATGFLFVWNLFAHVALGLGQGMIGPLLIPLVGFLLVFRALLHLQEAEFAQRQARRNSLSNASARTQLAELDTWLEDDLISEEDYQKQRQDLLAKMAHQMGSTR